MARSTLTPDGWLLPPGSDWARCSFAASGFATAPTQPGTFAHARVNSVSGGNAPTIEIRDGGPVGDVIGSVEAAEGAEIDMLASPERCPRGVYLRVTGDPARIDVSVQYRQG